MTALQMLRHSFIALIAGAFALTAAASTSPAANATPAAGERGWFVVLTPEGELNEPDFERIGGKKKKAWKNRRYVELPDAAVRQLAGDVRVKYLQRVMAPGEEFRPTAFDVEISTALAARTAQPRASDTSRISAQSFGTKWNSGEYVYEGT